MKKTFLFCSLFLISTLSTFSQCDEGDEPKVLLIGDSWAFFMNVDGTINNVLEHWGHSNYSYISNAILAVNGARAEDFLLDTRLTEIENQLDANPSIEVVHLSLGGNDFLGNWNIDFTTEETAALSDETYDEVIELIDFIKEARPGIRIVYSGYMYANFAEVIDAVSPFETSHPFYGTWESMGFPDFFQINTLLGDFSLRLEDLAASDAQIDFMNVPALMQYVYGQETPLGVDPGGTYAPLYQPLPFGDPTYPSPKEAMRDYGITRDCFHLSEGGYFNMIEYQMQHFYHKLFMDDGFVLAALDANNGAVDNAGTVGADLTIGINDSEEESKVVLSFNTTDFADTLIQEASIFLRREVLTGANPIGTTVILTMINGNLGSSPAVDEDDFADEGDISGIACVFGLNDADLDWIRIPLPTDFLPFITNDGTIQFSIGMDMEDAGQILFTNGSDVDFAPVFNVKYKNDFVGVEEEQVRNDFIVYPNPANNVLNVFAKTEKYTQIEIINIQGQVVLQLNNVQSKIDISNLVAGNYFIRIVSDSGANVQQFVKR